MSLVFSFEEDAGVEINIDVEGTSDTEAVEEVNDAAEEVEALLKQGENMEVAMTNLLMIHDHLTKFPVTKAMLHLMNRKGALGSALGINLPTAESDEVVEDPSDPLDADDVPEVAHGVDEVNETPGEVLQKMVLESIGERIKGWKDAVVAFFKKLVAKVKEFFAKYFGLAVRLEKRIKEAEDKFKKMAKMDIGAYNKITMDHMTKDAVSKILGVDITNSGVAATTKTTPASGDDIIALSTLYDADEFETEDEVVDGEKRIEKFTWKRKETLTEKETNSEVSKAFSISDLKGLVGTMKTTVKRLKQASKVEQDLNKTLDKTLKEIGKTEPTGEPEEIATAVKKNGIQIANTKKIVTAQISMLMDATKWQGATITHVLGIIGRIKVKS